MPDPAVIIVLLALVTLVEASPFMRIPIGLLLAIAMLAYDADLLPIALVGAAGVTIARVGLAISARRGRDRLGAASPAALAQREALRQQLSGSPAFARITFLLAALPGVPANFIFPLLGAMRAPLWPAVAGTLVGRTPVLALTAAIFAWLGTLGDTSDADAAVLLAMLAVFLLVFRTLSQVDWAWRAETGRWRMRDTDSTTARMTTMFGGPGSSADFAGGRIHVEVDVDDEDDDVVEGEVLGEETDADEDDDVPPPALPPSGRAPS